jgi:hypothetical protein
MSDSDGDDDDDDDDDGATEAERKLKKRARNRVNAKKSRLRKKFFVDSLKVTLDKVMAENEQLRAQLESAKPTE